jgi:phospholipase C
MKYLSPLVFASTLLSLPAFGTVTVTSPAAGSTVTSPVTYVASAATSTCSKGVASMGVYVNNSLIYVVDAASMNTQISMAAGAEHTVVEEWDKCGGATYTTVNLNVSSGSTPPSSTTGVTVTSPTPNSTVTSPVNYVASATTSTCSSGVASMGIYVDNNLVYVVNGSSMNTELSLAAGAEHTVVEEWDKCGGAAYTTVNLTVSSSAPSTPAVSISAQSSTITDGSSDMLTVTATNATTLTVAGSDGSSYSLAATGGTVTISPTTTSTYTADASNSGTTASAETTVTVTPASSSSSPTAIQHVVFMLQENHSFDDYFGMLNPYRSSNGWNTGSDGTEYDVDGIDDKTTTITNDTDQGVVYHPYKFRTTCVDDMSSAWLESYGDVSRWDFTTTRPISMDGFVHDAEGYANNCNANGGCSGAFTDTTGERAMGYYDETFLNYYYYMAAQFAVSDRWFSPVSTKTIPNRIATYSGGTTQGLANDPGGDDHLPQLDIPSIFEELDNANVPWKIYYTVTDNFCEASDPCSGAGNGQLPATTFSTFSYSLKYLYDNPSHDTCTAPTQPSSVVGDTTNSFCIDPSKIAPLPTYFTDLKNGTLPSFAFIESGSGVNDEHPGSGQSILTGQAEMANIINSLMSSSSWNSSVFFFAYDEGGGPYDHVPPVPGYSNQNTDSSLGTIPDISSIAVNPDSYDPCLPPDGTATTHCDLTSSDPGAHNADAAAKYGFAAQLGFRVPNIVISPFTRKHYVSHIPMDHTAIIKFVENRFISSSAHLTSRDSAQPNLLDFFDFTGVPWSTPPTPPTPTSNESLGYDPCQPTEMGP